MLDTHTIITRQSTWMASDGYGWRAAFHLLGMFLLVLFFTPLFLKSTSYWLLPFTMAGLGIYIHKLTILLHDCAHGTLFSNAKVNRKVGMFTAWLLGNDFVDYQKVHRNHHQHFETERDPDRPVFASLQEAPGRKVLSYLASPLLGTSALPIAWAFVNKRSSLPRSARGIVWTLFLHSVLAGTIVYVGGAIGWALFYPVSAVTFGVLFNRLRGFCEHTPIITKNQSVVVRTHLPNLLDRALFYTLNMNFHFEHHRYPNIPSVHLPRLHTALHAEHSLETLSKSLGRTLLARIRRDSRH